MNNIFNNGIELGRKHYAHLQKKGKRWKSRNIPKWMLDSIFVPYYITELDGNRHLYIIQMPIVEGEKAHYLLFASEGSSVVLNST
jgi:hypothetical protein